MRRPLAAVLGVTVAMTVSLTACGSSGGSRTFHAEFSRAIQVFPAVKVRVLGVAVGQVATVTNARGGVIVTFQVTDPDIKIPSNVKAAAYAVSMFPWMLPSESIPASPWTVTTVPARVEET